MVKPAINLNITFCEKIENKPSNWVLLDKGSKVWHVK